MDQQAHLLNQDYRVMQDPDRHHHKQHHNLEVLQARFLARLAQEVAHPQRTRKEVTLPERKCTIAKTLSLLQRENHSLNHKAPKAWIAESWVQELRRLAVPL
jgi:hypothetical protein